jgi:hypothetical protein
MEQLPILVLRPTGHQAFQERDAHIWEIWMTGSESVGVALTSSVAHPISLRRLLQLLVDTPYLSPVLLAGALRTLCLWSPGHAACQTSSLLGRSSEWGTEARPVSLRIPMTGGVDRRS